MEWGKVGEGGITDFSVYKINRSSNRINDRTVSRITYYKCNKRGYFADICPEVEEEVIQNNIASAIEVRGKEENETNKNEQGMG